MNNRYLAIALLIPFATTISAEAPTKVRVVNTGAVLEGSIAGKEKMEMLEKERQATLARLTDDQKKVIAKEKEVEEKASAISPAALEKLKAELQVAKADLQQKYEIANAAWQQKAQEETAELKGMLDEVVKKVAESCTKDQCKELVVVDQMTGSVLFASEDCELTTAAITEMDKVYTQKLAATKSAKSTTTVDARKTATKTAKTA